MLPIPGNVVGATELTGVEELVVGCGIKKTFGLPFVEH
jgi:hypothetical protein